MSVYITREMVSQAAHEWRHDNTVGILARLVRAAKRKWKRNEATSELCNLSDRELRDIGIYRGDIPHIVRQLDDHDLGLAPTMSRAVRGAQACGNDVPA